MILKQDVYQAIRPLEYFAADKNCSLFAVRLHIECVLSGLCPSISVLVFRTSFEPNFETIC